LPKGGEGASGGETGGKMAVTHRKEKVEGCSENPRGEDWGISAAWVGGKKMVNEETLRAGRKPKVSTG